MYDTSSFKPTSLVRRKVTARGTVVSPAGAQFSYFKVGFPRTPDGRIGSADVLLFALSAWVIATTMAESDPPTISNPLGDTIEVLAAVMAALVTLVVFMRLWGRRRYRTPRQTTRPTLGEPGYWIVVSDTTILFSYVGRRSIKTWCD